MKKAFLLLGFSLCGAIFLTGQENSERKAYFTKRIEGAAPKIDGTLDDQAWDAVPWAGDYVQFEPDQGAEPGEETAFKILYDDDNLYIAYRCYDREPDKIVSRMSRRDGFEGDWVEINIDSYHDLRTAFSFTLSVSGVKGDEFVSNDGNNWDESWNPIWYAATQIDAEGWTGEVRIPFSQLRFSGAEEQVWGIQSTRRLFRKEERSTWQYIPRNDAAWVSRFGELRGIKGIKPHKPLEIQPYVVAQLESTEKDPKNPFSSNGKQTRLSGGVDGRIGVTSDLILDFTVNPDFGQVEADPSAITLDGFQVFFSERRPFFVESRNIFDYVLTGSEYGGNYDSDLLFYSRRIGSSPHRSFYNDPSSGFYADQPSNATILGAAKFSGKTNKGLSIGILKSITEEERAKINANGEESEEVIEPFSNYFVGRLQQDFNSGNTVVGGMFTSVNRRLDGTGMDYLPGSAYTGGVDVVHRWNNQRWVATGKFFFSSLNGTPEAITSTQTAFEHYFNRPGATHLRLDTAATNLSGTGGSLMLGRYGSKIRFQTGATWRSPGLELNDIGFMLNADEINHWLWVGYNSPERFSIFRNFRVNYNHHTTWDFSGRNIYQAINGNTWMMFDNFWSFNSGVTYENRDISNNALFGGPALRRPNGIAWWGGIQTNRRKKLYFNLNFSNGWGFHQSVRMENYYLGATYQPTNALNITVGPQLNRRERVDQFVDLVSFQGADRYLIGHVRQNTLSITARLNYNITPNMTIQYYGQPFISRGRYDTFKRITDPEARYEDRYAVFSPGQVQYDNASDRYLIDENSDGIADYSIGNPDFNVVQFRSNLVARWEYVPGSELFLVWSQDNAVFADPSERLFPALWDNAFSNSNRNIFLIKWTYRFLL